MKRVVLQESVAVSFGGYCHAPSEQWMNLEMGLISSVVIQNANGDVVFAFGKDTAFVQNGHLPRTLIDCFRLRTCSSELMRSSGCHDNILLCLKQLFMYSPSAQKHFRIDTEFVSSLIPNQLTFHSYILLYSIFGVITHKELRRQWLERVILNLWIWSKAPFRDLTRILYHWTTVMVRQYQGFFARHSRITKYLAELSIFFVFEDNEHKPFQSVTDYSYFNDEYSVEEMNEVRSRFILFIERVAFLRLKDSDVDALLSFCSCARFTSSRVCYLEIVRDCAPLFTNKPAVLTTVLSFIELDEADVVVMALLALYELVGVTIHYYAHVLSFVSPLIVEASVVLDQLLAHLPKYPNM
jgi:hypothetical protein